MKILLIYPYFIEARLNAEEVSVPPIGIYYLGAALKENDYDVEILNWHDANQSPRLIEEVLVEKKPDVIGFSILHANRWGGIEIAKKAKHINPDVITVFGGIGATFLWKHLLTHFKEIDFIIRGEGEYSFLDLVKRIEKKNFEHLGLVKGIAYRKGSKIIKTGNAEQIRDIDDLPIPSRYFDYQHVSSSRGCPGNCTFCGSPQFWGHKVRLHSPEYFVDQLELLYKRGISFFYFSDDTFTIREDRVIEICRLIIQKDLVITWAAISRVNFISEKMLGWMRRAGCIQISYGVESGSEKIRNSVLNKNIKSDQIRRAFSLTSKYGIMARAYFIYGSPGETWETIGETIEMINAIRPMSIIFYILDLFPGTALYNDFKKRSRITDDIWLKKVEDIMYFETDHDLSEDNILAFGQKLRESYYGSIAEYADKIELVDENDFYQMHADFLSRLAMTFSHGDYAGIEAIKEKDQIAEKLYNRSLKYHDNHRGYLGLGIMMQKRGAYQESIEVLSKGIRHYPKSEQLNLCLGISYMNINKYREALSCFLEAGISEQAIQYIANCYQALGMPDRAAAYLKREVLS